MNDDIILNEQLEEKPKIKGARIAKIILLSLSALAYLVITILLLSVLIPVTSSEEQGLGLAAFIIVLLIYGSIGYLLSVLFSVAALIVSKVKHLGRNIIPVLLIILPIITLIVFFFIPHLLTTA